MAHRVMSLRCNDLSVFGANRTRVSHPPGTGIEGVADLAAKATGPDQMPMFRFCFCYQRIRPDTPLVGLVADVDPLVQVRVPLPAGSGTAGATQAAASYEYSNTSATPPTGAATANGTATCGTAAASGTAAANTGMSAPAADSGVSAAAAETGVSASAAAAAMTAPATAAAAATRNSNALAKRGIFPVEDLKGRQTDVGDFLLGQNKPPGVILRRYIRCGCGC
jgi:hypothetical protein